MNLLFLISGFQLPSSRFRLLQFIPHLEAAGHTVTVAASYPPKYDYFPMLGFRPSQLLKRVTRLFHLAKAGLQKYDAIVIERELFNDNSWWFERQFRRVCRRLVLDIDDGVFVSFPEKFSHLARLSDLVIAGNPLIEAYVRPLNPQVEVIPTCIDMVKYPARDQPARSAADPVVIGWIGTTGNLDYLKVICGALREAARRVPFELRLVAPGDGPLAKLPLDGVTVRYVPWDAATEVDQLRSFDIGLMPLLDDDWSRYKCGLKLLQYMAVGIPGVASPVGVNQQIVEQRVDGFLADTDAQWIESLEELCRDADLRQKIGAAARRKVEQEYSIQANLSRLISCFEGEVKNDEERMPKDEGMTNTD
jgi:glycosyltransferase involved in cell wall biosynthesis